MTQVPIDMTTIRTEGGPVGCGSMQGYLVSEAEWRRTYPSPTETPAEAALRLAYPPAVDTPADRALHAQAKLIDQLQVEMDYLKLAVGAAQRHAATAETALAAMQAFLEDDQQHANEPEPALPVMPARALRHHKQRIGLLTL